MSVPNQKPIIIHQSQEIPFLKIGVSEILNAYQNIKTKSAFVMYVYLSANADGFKLELSCEAFKKATGYSKSSYHRAIDRLTELGYIYEDNCGSLNFATTPKIGSRTQIQNWEETDSKVKHPIVKNETPESQSCNTSYSEMNTEINNTNNIDKNREIDKSASRSSLSYLKDIIAPNGEYIGGDKKGEWLEDEVPMLWTMLRNKDSRLPRDINRYGGFPLNEAEFIADSILNWNSRMFTFRDGDF